MDVVCLKDIDAPEGFSFLCLRDNKIAGRTQGLVKLCFNGI